MRGAGEIKGMGKKATDSTWRPPPRTLELGPDEVHVWRCALDLAPSRVEELLRSLSSDERARAEQLRFPMHRARFIAARGLLRIVLGRYVGMAPDELQFCRGRRESRTWPRSRAAMFCASTCLTHTGWPSMP